MAKREVALTTVDNPYDPFTQFDDWYAFDELMGYHSCALLARVAKTVDGESFIDNTPILEDAINDIIKDDPFELYKKVVREN